SIHAPGLGKNFSNAGFQLNTTYGTARPIPTVRKIRKITVSPSLNAKPSAVPRTGAVQDVTSTVVNKPLKNAPAAPCLDASLLAASSARPPSVTSNTPKRFNATSKTSVVRQTTKTGLLNCMPQPARCPAALTPMTTAASARNDTNTPSA